MSVIHGLVAYRFLSKHLFSLAWVAICAGGLTWASATTGVEATWDMRVCAPPYDSPASSREAGGFNNGIAHILAEEMNASVTFVWMRLNAQNIRDNLMSGECDVVIGISEGAGGALSTVPYARLPYVFVSLGDSAVEVTSLDDAMLQELRIGTYPSGVPSAALGNRGIEDNVTEFAPVDAPGGLDRDRPIFDAVVEGEVDVGIMYGPRAAERANRSDHEFRIVPVMPEVDVGATLLQLFRTWTIGVRPHDESFRDRLNLALAARWDEVQEAIADYGVPQLTVQRPPVDATPRAPAVALIAPTASGGQAQLEEVGMAALRGTQFAESALAQDADRAADQPRVLDASAPTDEAAVRAAGRLVATENVFALIGGFGEEQAERLGAIAEGAGVLFFNIAATDDGLRAETCKRTTFHVEASEAMYADAAIDWYLETGVRRFFIVHEDGPGGAALAERAAERIDAGESGGDVVGSAAVEHEQFVFTDAISAAVEADAELILLLLRPEGQELFMSQYGRATSAVITGMSHPTTQTRTFLHRLRDVNPPPGTSARIALWEASLAEGAAGELNERFLGRSSAPMEPTAWAAYAAVLMAFDALDNVPEAAADALVTYLEAPGTSFDVGKATPVSFRAWDHQLRQELYVVQVDEDASLGRSVDARASFARALGHLPEQASGDSDAALDRYGLGSAEASCEY